VRDAGWYVRPSFGKNGGIEATVQTWGWDLQVHAFHDHEDDRDDAHVVLIDHTTREHRYIATVNLTDGKIKGAK